MKITPDQLDCFLWWNAWLCGWGESSECHLDFKTFNTVSDSVLVAEQRRDGFYGWTVMWLKNWQDIWITLSGYKSSWCLVVNSSFQGLIWHCLSSCSVHLHRWPGQSYRGTSRSSTKGNAQSCIWHRITTCTSTGWGQLGKNQIRFTETGRGSWRMSVWTWVSSAILQQWRLPAHWTALEKRIICKFGEAITLSDSGGSQLGHCTQFLGLLQKQGQKTGESRVGLL